MPKSVSEKIGVKEKMRSIFINVPDDTIDDLYSPALDLKKRLAGKFDYIHLFVQCQASFHQQFPRLKKHLQPTGMLWVSWPKAGQKGTDLNIQSVIKLGYDYGLVESKAIRVNAVWSAIKFTWPQSNKVYNNSYGKLA